MKQNIETKNAPDAIGPYSQAVMAGNTLYISGQIPIVPESGEFAGSDIKTQTVQVLSNIKAILTEAGLSMSNVVKTTCLLKDMADFAVMNEVNAAFFTGVYPARATYQVCALPKDALIEIEAIAVFSL